MARITVRYLTARPGRDGVTRYFWQPSSALREQGFRPERVPENWRDIIDPAALEAAAIARAQQLNADMDRARTAAAAPGAPVMRPALMPLGRTLANLIDLYKKDPAFTSLADKTRRSYRQCLDRLKVWGGDAPMHAIDAPRIAALKAGLSNTPAVANAVIRVLRLLLEFGRRKGWLVVNPAMRPDLVGTEPSGLIWPRAAVDAMVQTADAMGYHAIGTAIVLNEWLAQRKADIIAFPRHAIRRDGLMVRQGKTGAGVVLPIHLIPHLQARLEAELLRHAQRERQPGAVPVTTLLVCEATGRPYDEHLFAHQFARVRAKLAETTQAFAIEHLMPGRDPRDADAFMVRTMELTFMQLRHTGVTRMAEAECDPTLISAVSGHSLATVHQILKRYLVRTAKLARLAFTKRRDAEAVPVPVPEDTGETDVG